MGEKIQEHLQHHMTDIGMPCSAKIAWHKQESADKKKMQYRHGTGILPKGLDENQTSEWFIA